MNRQLWLRLAVLLLLVGICGLGALASSSLEKATATPASHTGGIPTATPVSQAGGTPRTVTADQATPTRSIELLPTNTPLPPPPTPTPLPTTTPAPAGAATAAPSVTDVMAEIPGGPFTMGTDGGSPDEGPAHQVDVAAFQIDKFEVTNADFAAFVQATGYQTDAEKNEASRTWRDEYGANKDNHPVVRVTWNDAVAYCAWLDKRLPSESEWEKAARGPDDFAYPWGNDWDPTKANLKDSGLRGTSAVGSYPPNGYGLFDMAGNVWEWTSDWYQPYPGNTEPGQFYGEKFRVIRGGGWFEEAPQALTYNRNAADPNTTANDDLGFRCAK